MKDTDTEVILIVKTDSSRNSTLLFRWTEIIVPLDDVIPELKGFSIKASGKTFGISGSTWTSADDVPKYFSGPRLVKRSQNLTQSEIKELKCYELAHVFKNEYLPTEIGKEIESFKLTLVRMKISIKDARDYLNYLQKISLNFYKSINTLRVLCMSNQNMEE